MKGTLVQHGDGLAILLDEALRKELNLDVNTPIEILSTGETLVVTKAVGENRLAKLQAAIEKMDRQYGSVFQRLAE